MIAGGFKYRFDTLAVRGAQNSAFGDNACDKLGRGDVKSIIVDRHSLRRNPVTGYMRHFVRSTFFDGNMRAVRAAAIDVGYRARVISGYLMLFGHERDAVRAVLCVGVHVRSDTVRADSDSLHEACVHADT